MHDSVFIFSEADVETGEEEIAFRAPPHLTERPPLLEGIALLKQVESSAR